MADDDIVSQVLADNYGYHDYHDPAIDPRSYDLSRDVLIAPEPKTRYLEPDPTPWEGGDFPTHPSPFGLAMGLLGARYGRRGIGARGASPQEPSGARSPTRELLQPGSLRGGNFELPPSLRSPDQYTAIPGQPSTVKLPLFPGVRGEIEARPIPEAQAAARNYREKEGLPYVRATEMPPHDPEQGRRIAEAYDAMAHDPTNPDVKKAYDALIEHTFKQYQALKNEGFQFHFNEPGQDPYAASPALGYLDARRGHLSIFPTIEGHGHAETLGPESVKNNPLLAESGESWQGKPALMNDVFRAVHDMFGHYAEGNPFFRAPGEERAWVHHGLIYPESALGAVFSELPGQNSWTNYHPSVAERNKGASGKDTVYADQKVGLLDPFFWDLSHIKREEPKADGGLVYDDSHPRGFHDVTSEYGARWNDLAEPKQVDDSDLPALHRNIWANIRDPMLFERDITNDVQNDHDVLDERGNRF